MGRLSREELHRRGLEQMYFPADTKPSQDILDALYDNACSMADEAPSWEEAKQTISSQYKFLATLLKTRWP